jgi:hypothetical protein
MSLQFSKAMYYYYAFSLICRRTRVDCTVCTTALYFGSRLFGILKSIFFQKSIFPATSSNCPYSLTSFYLTTKSYFTFPVTRNSLKSQNKHRTLHSTVSLFLPLNKRVGPSSRVAEGRTTATTSTFAATIRPRVLDCQEAYVQLPLRSPLIDCEWQRGTHQCRMGHHP